MPKGTIIRLIDRGFGFIKTEEREGDLFFHRNDVEGVEFNSLREEQEVEFEISQRRDGRFAAVKVKLAEASTEDADTDKVKLAEASTEDADTDKAKLTEAPAEDAGTDSEDAGTDSEDAGGNSEG